MPRPLKQVVDYFPHMVNHGKTILVLRNEFGNDGYAFWFSLLELLCKTEGQVYDYNNPPAWRLLLAETHVKEETAIKILAILAETEAIDKELFTKKVIWIQHLVDNLEQVYDRRITGKPSKPVSANNNGINVNNNGVSANSGTPPPKLSVDTLYPPPQTIQYNTIQEKKITKGINVNNNGVSANDNPATALREMFFSFGNDPKYSGVDFDNEYQKFCEYWFEGHRKLTRQKLACHNWLDKCLEYAKEKHPAEKEGGEYGKPGTDRRHPGENQKEGIRGRGFGRDRYLADQARRDAKQTQLQDM